MKSVRQKIFTGWLAIAISACAAAAEPKLEPVETLPGGIEILSVPDLAHPGFERLLAKPPGKGPFPAVICNHGGRTGAAFIRDCLAFPANGFVAIACDLRHKEIPQQDFRDLKWEEGMGPGTSTEDIRRNRDEIAVLRSLSFVDHGKIAMYGHSGGGHLTIGFVALGNADRAVGVAAITSAGIYPKDPEHLRDPRQPGKFRVFPQLGHVKAMSPPIEAIRNITVPLLSIHGRLDHICPEESADALHEEMDRLGQENTLVVREQADHNDTKTPADFEVVIQYFRKHLGLPDKVPFRNVAVKSDATANAKRPGRKAAAAELPGAPAKEVPARRNDDRGAWVDPDRTAPESTLYRTCYSRTIRSDYSYLIALPPDYESAKDKRYPVIYWLHGGGGNQRTGAYFVKSYQDAVTAGNAPKALLVLVNGVGGSLFCDAKDGTKPVATVIINDLVPHIDATYRTMARREMRAIEGFSMGGFGALHLATKFPEVFGSMTALAHAPIRPNSGWPKVDLVYKSGPMQGDDAYFNRNDPFQLVEQNAARIRAGVKMRFIVGTSDNPNTQARTKEFYDKTRRLGIVSSLITVPDVAHSYMRLYDQIGNSFEYYTALFAAKP